ncbi:MAG: hypothetical protein JXR79_09075 [Nitrospirae bacterium]|nr:hypothetical protein [Nitrospirota bacterium]
MKPFRKFPKIIISAYVKTTRFPLFFLFVFLISCFLSAEPAFADFEETVKWLNSLISKLEKVQQGSSLQISRADTNIQRSQDMLQRAQSANNPRAEAAASQAMNAAHKTKEKAQINKQNAEADIKRLRSLLAQLQSGAVSDDIRQCDAVDRRLARETEMARQMQKTSEMGIKEIEQWEKMNEKAASDAMWRGVEALTKGFGMQLEAKQRSAAAFKGWITRYQKQLAEQGVVVESVLPKLERTLEGYEKAAKYADFNKSMRYALQSQGIKAGVARQADVSNIINKTMAAKDLYAAFKNETGMVAQDIAQHDASVKSLLEDPRVQKVFELEHPGVNLSQMFAAASAEEVLKQAAKFSDNIRGIVRGAGGAAVPVEFASFLVDYGYSAAEWLTSRKRILEQYNLTEDQLKAVKVHGEQMKKTVEELNHCRQGILKKYSIKF